MFCLNQKKLELRFNSCCEYGKEVMKSHHQWSSCSVALVLWVAALVADLFAGCKCTWISSRNVFLNLRNLKLNIDWCCVHSLEVFKSDQCQIMISKHFGCPFLSSSRICSWFLIQLPIQNLMKIVFLNQRHLEQKNWFIMWT